MENQRDVQLDDVVKLTNDHTGVVTQGEWWCVLGFEESPTFGPVANLGRIEHFPSYAYPMGAWAHYRVVPVAWLKVHETKSKLWKAARELPTQEQ